MPSAGWAGVAMWVGECPLYVPNLWVTSPYSHPSGLALYLGWGCVRRSSSLDQAWVRRGCFSNPSRNSAHESMIRAVVGSLRPAPGQLVGGRGSLTCPVSRSRPGSGPTVGERERGFQGGWVLDEGGPRQRGPGTLGGSTLQLVSVCRRCIPRPPSGGGPVPVLVRFWTVRGKYPQFVFLQPGCAMKTRLSQCRERGVM